MLSTTQEKLKSVWASIVGGEKNNYPGQVAVTGHNETTIDFIRTTRCRSIAELGIYRGHTSMEFAKYLGGEGELHLYDFEDAVDKVKADLKQAGYTNVKGFGCSYKYRDSYNWPLAKMLQRHQAPVYDYIFLDGAHDWAIDGLATLLCDRLLKVGGYLDFDDHDWSFAKSWSLNPKRFPLTAKMYTDEQVDALQVKMILDLLVRRDGRYQEVVENKIFQKIA
jgi:hypothetical protein